MSFEGIVAELPLGTEGLTGNTNQTLISPGQLLQATNVSYDTGSLHKEGGAAKYNTVALTGAPTVLGGWDWWPVPGVQRAVIYASDGRLLKDDGSGTFATVLATDQNTTGVPVFVEGGQEFLALDRKLFIFTSGGMVLVLQGDGAVVTTIDRPPADWSGSTQPICGTIHEGRLWAALKNRVYYSLTTDHENFEGAGAGSIAVFPGEGEKIVQIMSYKGLLIVWKYPVGIYVIDTSSPTVTAWRVTKLNNTIGGVSPLGACMALDDVLFLDSAGNFQFLSGILEYGQVGFRNISLPHRFTEFVRNNVALYRLDQARTIFYPSKFEAHIAVTQAGSSVNNARIVVDFNRSEFPRFRWSPRDVCESLWLRKDIHFIPRPACGDNAGFVWLLDQDIRSKDGAAYTATFQTPHTDLSFIDPTLANKRKLGQFLELVGEPTGNWTVSIDVLWDGKNTQTVTFSLQARGTVLGAFVLGTHALGGGSVVTQKRRITGSGRRISLIGTQAGAGQDVSLAHLYLYFTPGDERI